MSVTKIQTVQSLTKRTCMSETMNDDSRTFPHPVQTASALLTSTSISVDPQASHFISFDPGTPDPVPTPEPDELVAAMPTERSRGMRPEVSLDTFLCQLCKFKDKSEKMRKLTNHWIFSFVSIQVQG